MFSVNVPWLLRAIWSLCKGWMDQFTVAKINIRGGVDSFSKELDEFVDPECREERFGGKLPNKTSDFFPPDIN